ncbi:MAG: type IV secretion system protein [Deltaproteobacteria bacterium]|jgi:type IV secretion system protein VirB5|nr:type IV secretion system protein [Deltaproteobacteria bacterium]
MSLFKKNRKTNNPYIDGHIEWQEMFGSYVHQAFLWRIVAFLCLIISIISVYGNVYQAKQNKIVPYVVEIDKLGNALAVGRADVAAPIPRAIIQSDLARIIVDWRTVTADMDLQRRMVDRLSHFVAGPAQGFITEWFQNNNPYSVAKDNKLVQIDVKGLPLPVSNESWRVEWTETVRNHTGAFITAAAYEATMRISIIPPATDAQIMSNPGGIRVTELSYSRVLTQSSPNFQIPNSEINAEPEGDI